MKLIAKTHMLSVVLVAAALGILVPGAAAQVQTKKRVVAPVTKPWTKEPDSFRDAKFLSSEADVRSKFTFKKCTKNLTSVCPFEFRLANTDIEGILTIFKDSFVETSAIFDPDDFAAVRTVFVERYGEPTAATTDRLTWTGKSVSIELIRSVTPEFKLTVSYVSAERYGTLLNAAFTKYATAGTNALRNKIRMGDIASGVYRASNMNDDNKHDYEREKDRLDHQYEQANAKAEQEYAKDNSEASAALEKFQSASHSGFSITVNAYAAEVAKEKSEAQKKGAGAL